MLSRPKTNKLIQDLTKNQNMNVYDVLVRSELFQSLKSENQVFIDYIADHLEDFLDYAIPLKPNSIDILKQNGIQIDPSNMREEDENYLKQLLQRRRNATNILSHFSDSLHKRIYKDEKFIERLKEFPNNNTKYWAIGHYSMITESYFRFVHKNGDITTDQSCSQIAQCILKTKKYDLLGYRTLLAFIFSDFDIPVFQKSSIEYISEKILKYCEKIQRKDSKFNSYTNNIYFLILLLKSMYQQNPDIFNKYQKNNNSQPVFLNNLLRASLILAAFSKVIKILHLFELFYLINLIMKQLNIQDVEECGKLEDFQNLKENNFVLAFAFKIFPKKLLCDESIKLFFDYVQMPEDNAKKYHQQEIFTNFCNDIIEYLRTSPELPNIFQKYKIFDKLANYFDKQKLQTVPSFHIIKLILIFAEPNYPIILKLSQDQEEKWKQWALMAKAFDYMTTQYVKKIEEEL